jgi:hypothetical protein
LGFKIDDDSDERKKKGSGMLGVCDGKSSNGKSSRCPGECFLEEKMMQSLVVENFMRVIGTHKKARKLRLGRG